MTALKNKWLENPTGVSPISEVPVGSIDGINKDFILSNDPISGSLEIKIDGIEDTAFTYTGATKTISFTDSPVLGQQIKANYLI